MTPERQEELFEQLKAEHGLTTAALANYTGASESQARRWRAGGHEFPIWALAALLERCPSAPIKEAVVAAVLGRSGAVIVWLDGFGPDTVPALAGVAPNLAEVARRLADTIDGHGRAIANDGRIDIEEAGRIDSAILELIREAVRYKALVERHARMPSGFRQARPLKRSDEATKPRSDEGEGGTAGKIGGGA